MVHSSNIDAHVPNKAFDEADPHGDHPDAGHHVTSAFTLRFILGILIFFTVLTVGLAQTEKWATHAMGIEFPLWINVVIAMSIATVKCTLVLLYFMHLKHDNPINAIIFGFTILAFILFLFFTFLDIGNRGYIDVTKLNPVVAGGGGIDVSLPFPSYVKAQTKAGVPVYSGSIYIGAVEKRYAEIERRYLPDVHPALLDIRAGELLAMPTPLLKTQALENHLTIESMARIQAFNDTLKKAQEAVAAKTKRDLAAELEHHVSDYGLPHPEVLKKLQEKLGPDLYATTLEEALAHYHHAHAGHKGFRGETDSLEGSTANANKARKGTTPALFEASHAHVEGETHQAAPKKEH
ncbi:MAG: cytochrome C oxidase subunit IV family protein [Planctomycetota bacterium]